MEKTSKNLFVLLFIFMFSVACSNQSAIKTYADYSYTPEQIVIHDDGRIQYRQRLVSNEDILIYSDVRGVEKAAVKMRTGVQPDFYLGPYAVIRLDENQDKIIDETSKR